jgi:hypothetical protein
MLKVKIVLTDEQKEQLKDLHEQVRAAHLTDKTGMALGQIHFLSDGADYILCGFIENEAATKIYLATHPRADGSAHVHRAADRPPANQAVGAGSGKERN